VTFTITATPQNNNPITSVSVDFGDGQSVGLPGNAVTVQHVYTSPGQKQVTATATDASGASGSGSIVLIVQGTPGPTANFTITKANPATLTINVDGSSSTGSNLNYQWNFGDNTSIQNGVTTSHTYALAGPYTITLTVTDDQNRTASISKPVVVP
jgi:PKD repeat protein